MEYALSSRAKFYAEGGLSLNDQSRIRGVGNYSNGLITGDQAGRIFIPGDHPFNFFVADPANPTRLLYIGPAAWDNSIHTGADISSQGRILGDEFNGRRSPATRDAEINYYRGLGGFNVELADRWNLDMSYMFSRSDWSESAPFDYHAPTVNRRRPPGSPPRRKRMALQELGPQYEPHAAAFNLRGSTGLVSATPIEPSSPTRR